MVDSPLRELGVKIRSGLAIFSSKKEYKYMQLLPSLQGSDLENEFDRF